MIDGVHVIDFHAHQGGWEFYNMRDDATRMLRVMDSAGVDKVCLFNIFHTDVSIGHRQLASYLQSAPNHFMGFAYATALYPDMVGETQRAIDEFHFRAIKIYPPSGDIALTDDRWQPLFEFANGRGLAVISHTGTERSCEPYLFEEIAPRYPQLKFVIGHSGNVRAQREQAIAAAARWPNVYLETCSSYREPGVIEDLVAGAGMQKVLFGSDMPLMDPRCQIGKIITADLPDEAKRLILGGNAARLLGLPA